MSERKNSEARIRANTKYNQSHTVQVAFRANIKTDEDVIQRLKEVPNVAGYIKQLIRDDIARG